MLDLIKYTGKAKLRNLSIVFWPFFFPLLLATFFYLSFGNISEADFETIPVAVVKQEVQSESAKEEQKVFLQFLAAVSVKKETENGLLRTEKMTEKEAEKTLRAGKVQGIFYVGKERSLTVGGNGISQSILQTLLENYENGRQMLLNIAQTHPEKVEMVIKSLSKQDVYIKQVSLGGKTTDGNAQFFYALIGMACLYGCFIGFGSAMCLQANLTALAARRCVSPVHKMKHILMEILISFALHFFNIMVLLLYLKYGFRLAFGGNFLKMIPIALLGSMLGVSMGLFVSSIGKMGEGVKIGILIGVSMLCSFLAGLFNGTMKDVVERNIPFLNRVNPAAVIADALYSINVYDDPARYMKNLMLLGSLCILMVTGAFLIVRRERYDSI
ncbi:ABC transporter permease [Ruminococcus sp. AF18-22]|nr:ABC transporter permease [Ruminococcus sp. AF18-22]